MTYKFLLCTALGVVGGLIAQLFGAWNIALTVLCVCMVVDYGTGFVVAAVFHVSPKSAAGGLDSNAGWRGLARKVGTLVLVLMARFLDVLLGVEYVRDAVVIAFIVNEMVSIVENCGLMGLPIPAAILSAIDVLRQKIKPPDAQQQEAGEVQRHD